MLISEIAAEVMSEVGADATDSDLQTKIVGFIKAVLRRLPNSARIRTLKGVSTMTLAAAGQTTSLPTGCIQALALWIPGVSDRKNLHIVNDRREFNEIYTTSVGGKPENAYIYGTTVEYDRPADQQYTIGIEYYKEIDGVVAGDTFTHDSSMLEMVKDGVKAYYYNYTEEENPFAFWSKIFEASMQKLEERFQNESMPDYVEEY